MEKKCQKLNSSSSKKVHIYREKEIHLWLPINSVIAMELSLNT